MDSDIMLELLLEKSRLLRVGSERIMARLIEQCRTSDRDSNTTGEAQSYEWTIAHLPPEVVNKFGDLMVTQGSSVVDLSVWTLNELQALHQELEKGTIRVKPRVQLPERLSVTTKRSCTNCKSSGEQYCGGNLPCRRCVLQDRTTSCTYEYSGSARNSKVYEGPTVRHCANVEPQVESTLPRRSSLRPHQELETSGAHGNVRAGNSPESAPLHQEIEDVSGAGNRATIIQHPANIHSQIDLELGGLAPQEKDDQATKSAKPGRMRRDKKIQIEAYHKVLDRLKDLLATLLGKSCENMSVRRIFNRTPNTSAQWQWQFHKECPFSAFPKAPVSQWSLSTCREVEAALDADQISVTFATSDGSSAPSILPSEISLPAFQTVNRIVHNSHADSMHSFIDNNTGYGAVDPSLLLLEQSYEQPEDLLPATVHENHALDTSFLEKRVRDAETVTGDKIPQVSDLEDRIREADSKVAKYAASLLGMKGDLSSARVTIRGLQSQIDSPPAHADSETRITSLQIELNSTKNDNTFLKTEMATTMHDAASLLKKVSSLESLLSNTKDANRLLQLANAQHKSELAPLGALSAELKNAKTELEELEATSTNLEERLQASQKECELRAVMMNEFYTQQKVDRQTIEDLQQAQTDLEIYIASEQKTSRKAVEDLRRTKKDLKVQLASLQKTSQKTIADLKQADNDSKVRLDTQEKASQKTIGDLRQSQSGLKKKLASQERRDRKAAQDLEQALEELKLQLAASKETVAGHQREMEIQVANAKKAVEIQRKLEKQAAVANASGVDAGKRSALSVMEKQQALMWQGHSRKLEEARYEAIEIGRRSALEEIKASLDQARIGALVSLHKSWDGKAPVLLEKQGNLATETIALLEIFCTKTDSLTAYDMMREAIQQRFKSTATSEERSFVPSPDIQSALARHPFTPAPRKTPFTTPPRATNVAKSSVRPMVEAHVPARSIRSRSSSMEVDDDALRADIARQILSNSARLTIQKRSLPLPVSDQAVERSPKRMRPICSDSEDDCVIIDKPVSQVRPLPSSDFTIRNLMRLDRICLDSNDECATADKPTALKQTLANSDSVRRISNRAKSVSSDPEDDDDCTIVVDVSRLEDERHLREQKLIELSRRKRESRKQKSKAISSSAPKARGRPKKSKEIPCPIFPNLSFERRN